MKTIFALINLFFLAVCAFFCAEMVYKIMLNDTALVTEIKEPTAKPIKSAEKQTRKINLQSHDIIAQRNLFKVEIEKKQASDKASGGKEPVKLEPTTLSLILWGTVIGGSDLYAVIEDKKSGIQALYQEGDSVQDAIIKKILKKEVILSFQGKDQILEMETNSENTDLAKTPVNKSVPKLSISQNQNDLPLPQKPVLLQPPLPQNSNTGENTTKIKFRPFFTKGSPDGVMVYAIKPESVFNKAGIRNGDIVKSINGTPVSSVEDASSLISDMENSGNGKLTLIRSGETKEISYKAGGAGQPPNGKQALAAPEELKGEKLPDPAQGKGEIRTQSPEEQEPEKTESSDDRNKGEE